MFATHLGRILASVADPHSGSPRGVEVDSVSAVERLDQQQ
jgi:hypothetical protein